MEHRILEFALDGVLGILVFDIGVGWRDGGASVYGWQVLEALVFGEHLGNVGNQRVIGLWGIHISLLGLEGQP